jgi:hypothetical protein
MTPTVITAKPPNCMFFSHYFSKTFFYSTEEFFTEVGDFVDDQHSTTMSPKWCFFAIWLVFCVWSIQYSSWSRVGLQLGNKLAVNLAKGCPPHCQYRRMSWRIDPGFWRTVWCNWWYMFSLLQSHRRRTDEEKFWFCFLLATSAYK